jgi:hypothetical protein
MSNLHAYEVGKPYDPRRRSWPEGADYNFREGAHELRIFLAACPRGAGRGLGLFVRARAGDASMGCCGPSWPPRSWRGSRG